jgi:arylsulfatase A-like enzyme
MLKLLAASGASMAVERIPAVPNGRETRPNVLFIVLDDLNDWLGCLGGHPDVKTPNIDRLAQRGVLFANAFCSAPICNPSRVSVLTGIRPSTSGVYDNNQPWRPVLPGTVTLPAHFMAHGYRTIASGNVFHRKYPDSRAWHEELPLDLTKRNRPPKDRIRSIPAARILKWAALDVPDEEMLEWELVKFALNRLTEQQEEPCFVGIGLPCPHLPWYVPRKYFDMYPPDEVTLPEVDSGDLHDVPDAGRELANSHGGRNSGQHLLADMSAWREAVAAYLASISYADACVGHLLHELERSKHATRTVIVLCSDNGWHMGEKLHWGKDTLWEEATRVPLIVVAPGVARPGTTCSRTVSLLDIYPTLLELCGLKPREGLEGQSLVPLLEDPMRPYDRPAVSTLRRGNHSVRSQRWRFIRYADGKQELYDHEKDEAERTNLAGRQEYAPVIERLAGWLPRVNAESAPMESLPSQPGALGKTWRSEAD